MKVLLLENIHPDAAARLAKEGHHVQTMPRALGEDELIDAIGDVQLLGIRSGTNVSERVLAHAPNLVAVGAFCIGTNQIDLTAPPAAASRCSTRRSPTRAAWSSWPWPRSSRWPGGCRRRPRRCTPASGTSRRRVRTRSAAGASASWVTATSALSFPCLPRTWACPYFSTT